MLWDKTKLKIDPNKTHIYAYTHAVYTLICCNSIQPLSFSLSHSDTRTKKHLGGTPLIWIKHYSEWARCEPSRSSYPITVLFQQQTLQELLRETLQAAEHLKQSVGLRKGIVFIYFIFIFLHK